MKTALFSLACLLLFPSLAGGCSAAPQPPEPVVDPLAGIPSIPAGEISLAGETIVRIADGDFVHPAFSPDGSKLAYSGVVVQEGTELTEIWVHDLATMRRRNLLDSEASRKYAVYKSFIFGLEWKDSVTLQAKISDGDVDSTLVRLDAASGKILSEEFDDAEFDAPLDPALLEKMHAAVPSWRPEVLENAIRGGFPLGERGYVVQDDHVWLLDGERKQATKLLELPEGWHRALGGAFAQGETIVFLLKKQQAKTAHVLAFRDGSVTRLAEIVAKADAWLEVKHTSAERVIFLIQLHRSYEQGNNPLFVFDGSAVKRMTDVEELYDVAIDAAGKRICYAAWEGGKRILLVRDLAE